MADKMDVYSSMLVPFSVAAFCRGRRFLPPVVALGTHLQELEDAKKALLRAESNLARAESKVKEAVTHLEGKMRDMGEL